MSWIIDPAHSHLQFTVRHMMIAKVRGTFDQFNGFIDYDPNNPAETNVQVTVDVDSVYTREDKRDAHLRSPDFFDVESFPHMTFRSTRVEPAGEGQGMLYGDLTIKDKTNEIVLEVNYEGMAKSPWGTTSVGFSASGKINRKEWSLNWNQALETGGWLVGDEIKIDIEVELVKQEEQEEEGTVALA
jgi:polyisoprenoid-binding protein YceI